MYIYLKTGNSIKTIHKHGAGKSHGAGKTMHKHGAGKTMHKHCAGTTYHKLFGSFIAPLFVTGPQTAQQPEINSI